MGSFPEHRPGSVLRQARAIDLDAQDPVENQVDLRTAIALGDQHRSALHLSNLRFGRALHQFVREVSFEGGFDGRDEGVGVLVSPRRRFAEGLAIPVAEVDESGLRTQLTMVVVDPVARETTGPDQ